MRTGRHQSGRLAGIGVLAFGVLALIATWWWLKPGGHPLAGSTDYPLCDDVAATLAVSFESLGPMRIENRPTPTGHSVIECRFRFGDSQAGAGWLVGLQTTAVLRQQAGLRADTRALIETFVAESRASGQQAEAVAGPWEEGWLLSGGSGASILIAEDRGVVLTVIAPGIEPRQLVAPATALAERLLSSGP